MRSALVIMAVCVGCLGCAGAAGRGPQTVDAVVRTEADARELVDGHTGESMSLDAFLGVLRTHEVVYVGERHDRAEDHAVQNTILHRLHRDEPSLAIGMEMELVLEPFDRDAEGRERLTFAFAPVGTG